MFLERKICPICIQKKFEKIDLDINNNKIIKILSNYYKKKLPKIVCKTFKYEVLKCVNCSLLFQKYICDDKLSNQLYESIIDKNKSFEKKKRLNFKNFDNFIRELKIIKKIVKKPNHQINLLEFGCGWGFWSKLAQNLNFNINTVEISESRIKYLNENNIKNTKKIKKGVKYDLIYSDQVFEHLSYPGKEFSNLVKSLSSNGHIFIKVPSSFMMNLKKIFNIHPYMNILFPLEHINLYNKKVFLFLSKKYNLRICNYKILGIGGIHGIVLYLKNYFTNSFVIFKKNSFK